MCERALCVLAMAAVDDVVIGAPWVVTQELVTSLGISIVCAGSLHKVFAPLIHSQSRAHYGLITDSSG